MITDKLIKLLYNFLSEQEKPDKFEPAVVETRKKVVRPECVSGGNILGNILV